MNETVKVLKKLRPGGILSLTVLRIAYGRTVAMLAPFVRPGDLVLFSFPFIWEASPDLIYWNGGELVILFREGAACFRVLEFEAETSVYTMWRVW